MGIVNGDLLGRRREGGRERGRERGRGRREKGGRERGRKGEGEREEAEGMFILISVLQSELILSSCYFEIVSSPVIGNTSQRNGQTASSLPTGPERREME